MPSFLDQGLLHWDMLLLLLVNGFTTLITLVNTIYLNHSLSVLALVKKLGNHKLQKPASTKPRKRSYESTLSGNISILTKSPMNQPASTINTNPNVPSTLLQPKSPKKAQQHHINKAYGAWNKNRVITYFKIVPFITLFISCFAFYCAIFPEQAIWILPFMNIVVGFVFLTYIKMLILSCDGWIVVRHYLEAKRDICCVLYQRNDLRAHTRINWRKSKKKTKRNTNSPRKESKDKCCIKSNGYKGLKYKIKLCYLILLTPILNYATIYLQYYYNMDYISYIIKGLPIITCIIPIQMMRTIHSMLKPYSKMSHTHSKMVIVVCLSPLCQLQQAFISLIFQLNIIPETDKSIFMNQDLDTKYQWTTLYGLIICLEMFIISIIITWKAFPASDLMLWDKLDALMRSRNNSEVSMNSHNIGVTVDSDTEASLE